mmetsp:Transcript_16243/g.40416  ORF Transcript_16243/g.40416 Transcript_16243/m.40416 type:complete len:204 (+) Transcript_16243:939-1550(+)
MPTAQSPNSMDSTCLKYHNKGSLNAHYCCNPIPPHPTSWHSHCSPDHNLQILGHGLDGLIPCHRVHAFQLMHKLSHHGNNCRLHSDSLRGRANRVGRIAALLSQCGSGGGWGSWHRLLLCTTLLCTTLLSGTYSLWLLLALLCSGCGCCLRWPRAGGCAHSGGLRGCLLHLCGGWCLRDCCCLLTTADARAWLSSCTVTRLSS